MRIFLTIVFALFVLESNTTAALITFTDESQFLAATSNASLEGFESLPATNTRLVPSITTPNFVLSTSGSLGVYDQNDFFGTFATEGMNYVVTATNSPLDFVFANPTNALGFNITDFGDFTTNDELILTIGSDSFNVASAPLGNGNQLFFGVIETTGAFNSASLNFADAIGIDEVYTQASAVPEPSSLALLATAGILSACYRRRRNA